MIFFLFKLFRIFFQGYHQDARIDTFHQFLVSSISSNISGRNLFLPGAFFFHGNFQVFSGGLEEIANPDLTKSWYIVNWVLRNRRQRNLNQNTKVFTNIFFQQDGIIIGRSRMSQNNGADSNFGASPELGTMRKQPISPQNSRACSCAGDEYQVTSVTWLYLQPG